MDSINERREMKQRKMDKSDANISVLRQAHAELQRGDSAKAIELILTIAVFCVRNRFGRKTATNTARLAKQALDDLCEKQEGLAKRTKRPMRRIVAILVWVSVIVATVVVGISVAVQQMEMPWAGTRPSSGPTKLEAPNEESRSSAKEEKVPNRALDLAAKELAVNLRLLEEKDAERRAELEREMVSLREQRRALYQTPGKGD